ncbi:MAG TPA: HD domain-containing protein, partial [Solirubrobacterales bacterium]
MKRDAAAKGKQARAARSSKKSADGPKAAGKASATKKRRANGKPAAKPATKLAAPNGAPAPADRHGHTKVGAPAETVPAAPVDDLTRGLTAEQRGLLGDLFAVIGEHEDESLAPIDRDAVQHAFVFACDRHADQMRKSGDEFITHPVGVAQICAGMRLDSETLCAALLHDTVEDTSA